MMIILGYLVSEYMMVAVWLIGVLGGEVWGLVLKTLGGFVFSSESWPLGFLLNFWGVFVSWSESAFSMRLLTKMSVLEFVTVFWSGH